MAMISLDTILASQTEQYAPRALPWYGKLLATGVLALAPLVGAYAEEPKTETKPAASAKTADEYCKELDENIAKVALKEGLSKDDYISEGMLLTGKREYVSALANLNQAAKIAPEYYRPYSRIAYAYRSLGEKLLTQGNADAGKALVARAVSNYETYLKLLSKSEEKVGKVTADIDRFAGYTGLALAHNLLGDKVRTQEYLNLASQIKSLPPRLQALKDAQ